MPSALLARRLRSGLWRQKQVGAGHRGHWKIIMKTIITLIFLCLSVAAKASEPETAGTGGQGSFPFIF